MLSHRKILLMFAAGWLLLNSTFLMKLSQMTSGVHPAGVWPAPSVVPPPQASGVSGRRITPSVLPAPASWRVPSAWWTTAKAPPFCSVVSVTGLQLFYTASNIQGTYICLHEQQTWAPSILRWFHASCQSLHSEEDVEKAAENGFNCTMCRTFKTTKGSRTVLRSLKLDCVVFGCCGQCSDLAFLLLQQLWPRPETSLIPKLWRKFSQRQKKWVNWLLQK